MGCRAIGTFDQQGNRLWVLSKICKKGRSAVEFASDEMDLLVGCGGGVGDGEGIDAEFLGERREAEVDMLAWRKRFI